MTTMYKSLILWASLLQIATAFAGWGPKRASIISSTTLQEHFVKETIDGIVKSEEISRKDDKLKTTDILSLDYIRSTLIRQEETIIFALIERSQFRQNLIVYEKGGFGDLGSPPGSTPVDNEQLSFLEYMLVGTETLHCG